MRKEKKITPHNRYEVGEWRRAEEVSWWAHIYIGGNYQAAEMVCRKACFPKGLCVTIEPIKYIFGGGSEDGVRVGMIQYPPFPEDEKDLIEKAISLGKEIVEECHQFSFSIVTPASVINFSRRQ